MITVIAGTNRADSMTLRMASHYFSQLSAAGPQTGLLSLEGYNLWDRAEDMLRLESEFLIPTTLFVFIMPEYNGSFPGVLKLMMDNADIKQCFRGKKAALVGVSDGRAGNLRGLDHMTNILNYLKMQVWPNKLPISRINEEINGEGELLQAVTKAAIQEQIAEILAFYRK